MRIARRNGDNWDMAAAVAELAFLATDTGDWHRAAMLHGVAQALRDRTVNPWQEHVVRDREDSLNQARAHLGDQQLELALRPGQMDYASVANASASVVMYALNPVIGGDLESLRYWRAQRRYGVTGPFGPRLGPTSTRSRTCPGRRCAASTVS